MNKATDSLNLVYAAFMRMPTEKAQGLQAAKTIDSLISNGVNVECLFPKRINTISVSMQKYYKLQNTPKVEYLLTPHLLGSAFESKIPVFSNIFYFLEFIIFGWGLKRRLVNSSKVVFIRNLFLIFFIPSDCALISEVHELPINPLFRKLLLLKLRKSMKIIAVNNSVEKILRQSLGNAKVVYLPNAIDHNLYRDVKQLSKKSLGLQPDDKLVLYVGSLEKHKGVLTLAQSQRFLPNNFRIVISGGPLEAFLTLKKYILHSNLKVILLPQKSYQDSLRLHKSADILVLPNSSNNPFSNEQSSPLKLSLYLPANKPIVASSVPSIRSLNLTSLIYFKPDDAQDLAKQIIASQNKNNSRRGIPQIFDQSFRANKIKKIISERKWREPIFEPFFRRLRFRKVLKLIPKSATVVDVGCGHTPNLLNSMSSIIDLGIGIDPLVKNHSSGKIKLISQMLTARMAIPSNFADVVTLVAVLEHLENPSQVLRECFRVLKPGGKVILTTPTPFAKPVLEFLAFRLGLVSPREIAEHKSYFLKKDLMDHLSSVGFVQVHHSYFEFFFNNFCFASKPLSSKKRQ